MIQTYTVKSKTTLNFISFIYPTTYSMGFWLTSNENLASHKNSAMVATTNNFLDRNIFHSRI